MFYIKRKIMLIVFVCVFFLCSGVVMQGVKTVFRSGSRNLPLYSVERADNAIALTFNCAWGGEDIEIILRALDKYKAKATFFIVGQWAEKYPGQVNAIAAAGHELGGHSYDHKDYQSLSGAEIKDDIRKTADAIEKACGISVKLIRVPSGSYNSDVISAVEEGGYTAVQWSVDSIDYGEADADGIYARATSKTKAGDIILMHTGTKNTALTLPRILDSLSGKFEFLKVSELMYKDKFIVGNDGKMKINN